MTPRLNPLQILHLISRLRRSAEEGQQRVDDYDDDGLQLCLAAGLMVDAADTLEALLSEWPANDDRSERKLDDLQQ